MFFFHDLSLRIEHSPENRESERERTESRPETCMFPTISAVVETGFYVDDLDRAEVFYSDVLGLKVIARETGRHLFFQVGDSVLLAFRPDATLQGDLLPAHGSRGPGHFALGIPRDAYATWLQRLLEHGIAIEQEVDWPRGGKSMYFRDPAGNSVELVTPGIWGLPSGW
jgi:catechol 2,3-dioxygenase-like lactoylglutathione lyase family enzyme